MKKNNAGVEFVSQSDTDVGAQIVDILASARKAKRMTQKDLAAVTGITQPDISRLENGRGNPSLKTLNNLARGLGMALRIEFVDIEKSESRQKKK